jgi:hypothetical protein
MATNIEAMKAALVQYDAADKKVEDIKAQLEVALSERSNVVKTILGANDGVKKFRRSGKELTIVIRGDTYFFRGSKEKGNLVDV